MILPADERWIRDGVAEIRRLVEQGRGDVAAVMAAWAEGRALGRAPTLEPLPEIRCSVCERRRLPGVTWCASHAPTFIPEPMAEPAFRFWWVLAHERLPPLPRGAPLRRRRRVTAAA